MSEENRRTVYDKIVDWFDVRFGFAKTPLRPIPDFTLNPIYWLGLILAITFGLQAFTGIFMLLYYVPTPQQAYSSTQFIINSVPLGQLVETLHLYTAYAMIILTFLHLVRNYFGSAHKGNRELMWLVGIVLAVVVVSFGVTGYLLPWTVVSKSASDVAIGFLNFFPVGIANLGKFVAVGTGSDASELTTFLHVHTVFLPLAIIALIALKIYMYEVHGPIYISAFGKPGKGKIHSWFPKIFLYATMLMSIYVAILLAASALFPLALPPAYSAASAGTIVVQPDWYLLWVYQLLKIQVFEGSAAAYLIAALIVFGLLLFFMPFYDRNRRREISKRPVYTAIGSILIVELAALTIWGYLTPGQIIPTSQAAIVLIGLAILTAVLVAVIYKMNTNLKNTPPSTTPAMPSQPPSNRSKQQTKNPVIANVTRAVASVFNKFTAVFVFFLAAASICLASIVNMLPTIPVNLPFFAMALAGLCVSAYFLCQMLRKYVLAYEGAVTR